MKSFFFLLLIGISVNIFAQNSLEQGISYYKKRADGALGAKANTENIDRAIEMFRKGLKDPELEKEAAGYLLECYYFKGTFTGLNKDQQKEIFLTGKEFGETMMQKYPKDPAIINWYMACAGKWGLVYGKLTAAREGLADILKENCEKLIEIDANYNGGAGYRVYGALHYEAPYIPFILTWPDNDDAISLLRKAYAIDPTDPNTLLYLARALEKEGEEEEAKKLLQKAISQGPRANRLVEDQDDLIEIREFLDTF